MGNAIEESFMRSLCMGIVEQDLVLPFPALDATERETLHSVIDSVDALLGPLEQDFRHWDARGEMPEEFLEKLAEFGSTVGLHGVVLGHSTVAGQRHAQKRTAPQTG